MEQNKADIPMIRAVRVAAMGPLGGIGDALFWFTLVPITAGITANMAINGNIAAPFIFLLVFNAAQFGLRFFLMHWSYRLGTDAIGILTENAKEFTRAASILGIFVVGSLTCVYGATSLDIQIPNGTTNEVTQATTIVDDQAAIAAYGDMLYTTDENGQLTDTLQENAADKNPLVVGVLKGAVPFMADIVREMDCYLELDYFFIKGLIDLLIDFFIHGSSPYPGRIQLARTRFWPMLGHLPRSLVPISA